MDGERNRQRKGKWSMHKYICTLSANRVISNASFMSKILTQICFDNCHIITYLYVFRRLGYAFDKMSKYVHTNLALKDNPFSNIYELY